MALTLEQLANNASTTLNGGINNSTTSVVVVSASGFPSAGNFRIIIDSEIMLVTSVSGTTFTVTRGAESTVAVSHLSAAAVTHIVTKASLPQVAGEIASLTGTYANLPAAGVYGRQYRPTDVFGGHVWRDNGTSWDLWVEDKGPFNPNIGDFGTWVNQNSFTFDTTYGFGSLQHVNGAGGDNITARVKATSGTTWAMTLGMQLLTPPGSIALCGIVLRESSSGKMMTYTFTSGTSTKSESDGYTFSNTTTVNTHLFGPDAFNYLPLVKLMRLRADGTTFFFEYSLDGTYWFEHNRLTISGSYLAGYNQIGFGMDMSSVNNVNQTHCMNVYHAVYG